MKDSSRLVGYFLALVCSGLAAAIVGWPNPGPPQLASVEVASIWEVPAGYWGSAEQGVALVPPAAWTEARRAERDYLDRVPGSPGDGNFCVITIPNMLGLSFDQLDEQNRAAFETMAGLELVAMERLRIDEHDVLRTEYKATHLETGSEYHCLGIAFLRGGQQVVLTLTVDADQWDDLRELAWSAIDSVVLAPG